MIAAVQKEVGAAVQEQMARMSPEVRQEEERRKKQVREREREREMLFIIHVIHDTSTFDLAY